MPSLGMTERPSHSVQEKASVAAVWLWRTHESGQSRGKRQFSTSQGHCLASSALPLATSACCTIRL